MSILETPLPPLEASEQKTPYEQAHEIARRFFASIDSPKATTDGPVFIAYFMQDETDHADTEEVLVRAVEELCAHPDSNCVWGTNTPTTILASLASGNQLVVSEQPEARARSYWVCGPGQEPLF